MVTTLNRNQTAIEMSSIPFAEQVGVDGRGRLLVSTGDAPGKHVQTAHERL